MAGTVGIGILRPRKQGRVYTEDENRILRHLYIWNRNVAVLGAGDRIRFLMFTAVMHTDGGSFNCSQVMMRIHSRERQHIADGQQASTCQYHRQR